MDFSYAAAISASGMNVERTRLDIAALNLANMHTTRSPDGGPAKAYGVAAAAGLPTPFARHLAPAAGSAIPLAQVVAVEQRQVSPRLVFEPGHPDADGKGFVAYPGIDAAAEMVNVMTAVRAYEANVMALNGAKAMALKALDIGSNS